MDSEKAVEAVTIQGTLVQAVSPEGQKASMPFAELVAKLAPPRMDTGDVLLSDGVVSVKSRGRVTVWVHQTPPRVFSFKWIANDSPSRYGRGTKYRTVKLAMPYLVVLAVFLPGENGWMQLGHQNECFFRNKPLGTLDDELLYPALLNCSKFHRQEGNPLSWICTQNLDRMSFVMEADTNKRLRGGFKALMHCLLETGFNYSSEHHEQSSWFSESLGVDARISTVERWEQSSEKDPLFVTEVPWLKTGLTIRQVVERILKNQGAGRDAVTSAADVARLVFNHRP